MTRTDNSCEQPTVRLDKWLWAARFYKTRSLAQAAIQGGKVHMDGQRIKAGKAVRSGAVIRLRQGFDEKEVIVLQISDKRRGAPEAQLLYEETAESLAARQQSAEQRRRQGDSQAHVPRPDKKQRRQLKQLRDLPAGEPEQ